MPILPTLRTLLSAGQTRRGVCAMRWPNCGARWLHLAGEGGSVLVVCHGGIIELGAVACLPNADHVGWGAHASYCEGVRLAFDGTTFLDVEVLRV